MRKVHHRKCCMRSCSIVAVGWVWVFYSHISCEGLLWGKIKPLRPKRLLSGCNVLFITCYIDVGASGSLPLSLWHDPITWLYWPSTRHTHSLYYTCLVVYCLTSYAAVLYELAHPLISIDIQLRGMSCGICSYTALSRDSEKARVGGQKIRFFRVIAINTGTILCIT